MEHNIGKIPKCTSVYKIKKSCCCIPLETGSYFATIFLTLVYVILPMGIMFEVLTHPLQRINKFGATLDVYGALFLLTVVFLNGVTVIFLIFGIYLKKHSYMMPSVVLLSISTPLLILGFVVAVNAHDAMLSIVLMALLLSSFIFLVIVGTYCRQLSQLRHHRMYCMKNGCLLCKRAMRAPQLYRMPPIMTPENIFSQSNVKFHPSVTNIQHRMRVPPPNPPQPQVPGIYYIERRMYRNSLPPLRSSYQRNLAGYDQQELVGNKVKSTAEHTSVMMQLNNSTACHEHKPA